MPVERTGYTVTMFLVDTSPSMAKSRIVDLPDGSTTEMTNLEWSLQFVKLKIQEMIYNGRKTDQCGVVIFGSEDTDNIINEKNGGYDHVSEYISIAQPSAATLAKLDALSPSTVIGDPIDALIVGIETQHVYLANKRTWTRKIVLLTDGENPIEIEDWEATVDKMNTLDVSLTIIGVDFDDDEFPFHEEDKSTIKRANEVFFTRLTSQLTSGLVGTCALALRETTRPDIKQTRSTLMGTVLRLGDVDVRPEEALEVLVKASKYTAKAHAKSWKKFGRREREDEAMDVDDDEAGGTQDVYAQLTMRTEYYIDRSDEHDEERGDEEGSEHGEETGKDKVEHYEKVDKEQLVRGYKYGATYVPCPDGQFPRLSTRKGIDICGFFHAKNFRRELAMGEVQYLWADPGNAQQQLALSSIVQAMYEKDVMAIARWVSRDGMDPKMGVLKPSVWEKVDCLLWVQMPFADDVRKYSFASLDNLVSKKGEPITKHAYLPTEEQLAAMDNFVDAMDLTHAGEKDEDGERQQWFDPRFSYNPAVHRTKQALFHSAVVNDLAANPIPPPHPELLKYFEPPKRALKRARDAIDECKAVFKVKQVPKKVTKTKKDGHVHARDADEEVLLLDMKRPSGSPSKARDKAADDSATESEDEGELILEQTNKPGPKVTANLPTPERSPSPPIDPGRAPGRIIGTTYPLADFRKNIAVGDVVSKAVEDLEWVIREILSRPFGGRRSTEMVKCMRELREVSLKEDEIDAWNTFLKELRQTCLSESGDKDFWATVQNLGREMSLISEPEAAKYGGISQASEAEAEEFLQK